MSEQIIDVRRDGEGSAQITISCEGVTKLRAVLSSFIMQTGVTLAGDSPINRRLDFARELYNQLSTAQKKE